jgi:hypothetical protein
VKTLKSFSDDPGKTGQKLSSRIPKDLLTPGTKIVVQVLQNARTQDEAVSDGGAGGDQGSATRSMTRSALRSQATKENTKSSSSHQAEV